MQKIISQNKFIDTVQMDIRSAFAIREREKYRQFHNGKFIYFYEGKPMTKSEVADKIAKEVLK